MRGTDARRAGDRKLTRLADQDAETHSDEGAIAAVPAIANAILDALAPFSVADFTGPATLSQTWRSIKG